MSREIWQEEAPGGYSDPSFLALPGPTKGDTGAMGDANLERLKAVYAELAKGNMRAGAELFSPDVSYEPMAEGYEALHRADIEPYMREFLEQWDDFQIEAVKFEQVGETILVTERQRGTGKSSGIDIDQTDYAAWTFRDGLVTKARWRMNRDDALDAQGTG
jgi:ketosteroid isomerase-like protein